MAPGRLLPPGGCKWENADVMDYGRLEEFPDLHPVRSVPVKDLVMHIDEYDKLRILVYIVREMQVLLCCKPTVQRTH